MLQQAGAASRLQHAPHFLQPEDRVRHGAEDEGGDHAVKRLVIELQRLYLVRDGVTSARNEKLHAADRVNKRLFLHQGPSGESSSSCIPFRFIPRRVIVVMQSGNASEIAAVARLLRVTQHGFDLLL